MAEVNDATRAARAFSARLNLVQGLETLPYSHAASSRVPLPEAQYEQDITEFLIAVRQWIRELRKSLVLVHETSAEMQAELTALRGQRQAVREFFGIASPPDPFGSREPGGN